MGTIPIDLRPVIALVAFIVLLLLTIVSPHSAAMLLGEPFALVGKLAESLHKATRYVADAMTSPLKRLATVTEDSEPEEPPVATPTAGASAPSSRALGTADPLPRDADARDAGPAGALPAYQATPWGQPSQHGWPDAYPTSPRDDLSPVAPEAAPPARRDQSPALDTASPAASAPAPRTTIHPNLAIEAIVTHVLYFVMGVVMFVSDLEFSILRLAAVLLPSLPVFADASKLSLFASALFVAMIFLTGALILDFTNVLPPAARLFPQMRPRARKWFFATAVASLVLNLIAVPLLWIDGQILVTLQETWPFGALLLSGVLALLQVLVLLLSAWGVVRGLGVIIALLLGIVGGALTLLALALEWLALVLTKLGTELLPELIYGLHTLFHYRPEQRPVTTPVSGTVLAVVGVGENSSEFAVNLGQSIIQMHTRSSLLALGVYAPSGDKHAMANRQLDQFGRANISPSEQETEPMVTLMRNVIRAFQRTGNAQKTLLWVMDAEQVPACAGVLDQIKRNTDNLSIVGICHLPATLRSTEPVRQLARLAVPAREPAVVPLSTREPERLLPTQTESALPAEEPILATTILVDERSPIAESLGKAYQPLIARSLAGIALAPIHISGNESLTTIIEKLREDGYPYAALAVSSTGLVTVPARKGCLFSLVPWGSKREVGIISPRNARIRAQDLTMQLMSDQHAASTFAAPIELPRPSVHVSILVPLSVSSPSFRDFRDSMTKWLADRYKVYSVNVLQGVGQDLSKQRPETTGDAYLQVGVFYGVHDLHDIAPAASPFTARPV